MQLIKYNLIGKAKRALSSRANHSRLVVTRVQNVLRHVSVAVCSQLPFCINQALIARLLQALCPIATPMWQKTNKGNRTRLMFCDDLGEYLFDSLLPNLRHWRGLGNQDQTIVALKLLPLLKGKSCNGIRFSACYLDQPIDRESHYFFLLFKLSNAKESVLISRFASF